MKSFIVRFVPVLLPLCAAAFNGPVDGASAYGEERSLDSLAADIAAIGFIPPGPEFRVLAAARGWFGQVSGVRILPPDSRELASLIRGGDEGMDLFGMAPWSSGGDVVVVTAPPPRCLPGNMRPFVPVGSNATFRLHGYDDLKAPQTAVRTPGMDVIDLTADSSGTFAFEAREEGAYWVGVMELSTSGPVMVLLFPIISGGTAGDVLSGRIAVPSSEAGSPGEILDELNGIRRLLGREDLKRCSSLDSAAAVRARELALSGSITHSDGEPGGLRELLSADIDLFAENISRGRSYQEAWTMVLTSPFHLRASLRGDYTLTGMAGAVDSRRWEWQLVMVQVFASGRE